MAQFFLLLVFVLLAVGLAWFLVAHDRGQKEPVAALWLALGFGAGGAIAAGALEGFIPANSLLEVTPHGTLLLATLGVGVIEEACKFIPLAFVLYKKRFFNEHTDGVIYFALAGLGFGLPENLLYTLQYGNQTGLIRVAVTPFFHAATTGIVGYFLARRKLSGRSIFTVLVPLVGVMVLHGFYDFGLLTGMDLYAIAALGITFGATAGLFILYLRANQLDQDRGISAVGHNAFCRSCGWANPHHNLYCAHCGKNA